MSNDVLITPASRKIELKDSNGNVDAKIETDSSGNLLITNAGGDISIGDTTSDVFIGDGTNSVDIVFEQSGEIRGTSGVTLTLGDSNTTLRTGTDLSLNSNDITNVANISTTDMSLSGTMTLTGSIDYTPDTGTLIKFDGQNILTRNTANGAITFGHDDAILITAGDTTSVMNSNINEATETVYLAAEGGFYAYAFPNNDTSWSNRKELRWDGANLAIGGTNVISAAGAWVGSSSGLKGEPGAKGQKGQKGEIGVKGIAGAKGQKGEAGVDGTKGATGQKGATGEKGNTGQKGQKGQAGVDGDKGATGAKGQKGQAGTDGDKGATGQKGQKGDTGQKGQKGQKGQSHITGTVAGVSNSGWTTAFTVVGAGLGSQVRATFVGTANNVVVNTMADIIVNHSQDILVETKSGFYTLLSLRVISDNNEDFAVQVKTNHANTVTLAVEVFPLNNETVTITTSHSYTGSTYTHDGSYGVKIGGTGGNSGDLRVGGDYYAGTTKVINSNGTWAGSSSGLKGEPGAKGQKGQKGEVGQKGDTGQKGQKGEVGVKGIAGTKGQKGDTGQKGQKGEIGQKGITGLKGQKGEVGQKGQKGNEAGNAGTLDGYDSSRFMRRQTKTNATVGPGWMTVATNTSGRKHGEVVVTDADSGDHAFVRIDWMRSYADSNFSVLQCGGHGNRITGARVLYQTSDNTYGVKLLQVYVTTSSNYEVNVYEHGDIADFDVHTAVTPVIENSKTGYALHGSDLTALDNVSLAAEEAISANGYYVDNTQVINASGAWVGSSSGLKGEPGAKGQKGEPGAKGATGAKGQKGEPGAKGQKGEIGVKGITGQKGQKGEPGAKGQKGEIGLKGQKGQQGSAASDASRMDREDNRTISPSELTAGHLKFGFTSWANNNSSPYADFLHMRSYTDSSGGSDNLFMLKKSGLGARVWQQTWGSSTAYSSYVDLIDTGSTAQTKLGDLTLGSAGTQANLIIQKADDNISDHIQFYTGSTRMGEIGAQDTTWLRINQVTSKNIYTPRKLRVDGGIQTKAGSATAPAVCSASDLDTGIFMPGSDVFKITTGGVNAVTINTTDISLIRGNVSVQDYLRHYGDTDTYFRFTTDRIRMVAGNVTFMDATEGTTDYLRFPTRAVTIGNNTAPNACLTIEQNSTTTPADGGGTAGQTHLRIDNSNTGPDASSVIVFNADDAGSNTRHGAGIQFKKAANWTNGGGSYPGELYFWTRPSSGNQAAAQKLDKDGNAIFKGNVTAYGSLSDRRLKENIENIPDATEKVQKLNGVTFNYKKDGKKATGLIAQELQEVLPEAVYTSENIETGEEHLAIHYGNVIGLLVESIKELKAEIEELKNGNH